LKIDRAAIIATEATDMSVVVYELVFEVELDAHNLFTL